MIAPSILSPTRALGPRLLLPIAVAATSLVVGAMVSSGGLLRPVFAATAAFLLVILGLKAPRILLIALVPWLAALGLLRRLLSGVSPSRPTGDPLLLVAAVAWVVIALMAFRRGALTRRSPLANSVLALTCLLAASAVNPLQGSPLVGVGGLLIVIIPMLAFWVGRSLNDERSFTTIVQLIILLASVGAIYGLAQTFSGLPSWDHRWVVTSGYTALSVNGATRAFGTFSSASEYATFLALGLIACLAYARRAYMVPIILVPAGLLAAALWFESSRGIIVLAIVAIGIMFGAAKGVPLGRSFLIGLALLGALPFVVRHVTSSQTGTGQGSHLAAHQVQGLSDPFGQASTLPGHIARVTEGVRQAVANPLGRGIGSVTIAADKFGGTQSGTEGDPGNAGIAAGFLGLAAYIAVFVTGFGTAYRVAQTRRDPLSLAVLGMVVVTFLQWLNGGQYAVAFVPWLLFGWSDATLTRQRQSAALPIMQAAI